MRRSTLGSKQSDLIPKLKAVRTLAKLGEGRVDAEHVALASALAQRAEDRLTFGSGFTVVALAGATGSGKSSLFNALVGSPVSTVGVRRPTTAKASAAVWGGDGADELLSWLGVDQRHRVPEHELDGLILLDLPDHDSTQAAHRSEVDRLVELVDVFVWVVDPQKYADSSLHDGYLKPMAGHAAVTLVVLNQADRLSDSERDRCLVDLRRLLDAEGLERARLLWTSVETGEGVPDIRSAVAKKVEEERSLQQRLEADVAAVAARFMRYCDGAKPRGVSRAQVASLSAALATAAGAETVAEAARRSYLRDAKLKTGWAITIWTRRLRPDPLGRLHLGRGDTGRTSAAPLSGLARSRVASAQRATAAEASSGLPEPWPRLLRERAEGSTESLLLEMDRAIGEADVRPRRSPSWWALGSLIQKLFLICVVAGFVWLGVLFALEWFKLPDPPTPEIRSVPWPTLLFFGGLLAGFVLAAVFGLFARIGAARARRRAQTSIEKRLQDVAAEQVVAPLERELAVRKELCESLAVARD